MPSSDAQPGTHSSSNESLSSVVFERTDLGTAAVKSISDDIPRSLRTLMLVIDGRSQVAQYEPFLTALGSLPDKFEELERMGYVRRKSGQSAVSSPSGELIQKATIDDVIARPIKPVSAPSTTSLNEADLLSFALDMSVLQGPQYANNSSSFVPDLQALASNLNRDPQASFVNTSISPDNSIYNKKLLNSKPTADTPTLQDLLGEMESFLSSTAGLDGLHLALMFGQITSLAQLRRELPAYLELLQPYGAIADTHVERLAGLLDRAQS